VTATYGRLGYEHGPAGKPGRWIITNLAPHVAMAFKRLFPRVAISATNIVLNSSDDVCADLQWFMLRYPLETVHAEELERGAQRARDRLAERDRILLPDWTPGEILGFKPGKAPYLYQSQAAQITLNNGGLLLGDEVGLGKTVSAATVLVTGAPLPAAVVVQPHIADQWASKLREFTTLRVHVIKRSTPYTLPAADVYVYGYSKIAGWTDYLKDGLIRTVIYDELQELRHGTDTDKGKCCSIVSAKAEVKMGLTATPIYNYGDEMHTIMGYLNPDLLGSREEFLREWCGSGLKVSDPDALGSYLRSTGWFLRRTEDDPTVDRSMPPPNIIDFPVAWDSGDAAAEDDLIRTLAQSVMSGSFMEAGRAARELDLKMRMMTGIAKARAVAAYVRLLLRGGTDRVLLVGWHRDVYGIWQKMLADYEPLLYTGSESAAAKAFTVSAFTEGRCRVMFMSLRSGVGLDGLQHNCHDVVFGELDWSPQVHHQIIGRLRRPGQAQQVNAHYLHTDQGSDPVLIETLGVKSDQSRGVIDPGAGPAVKVSDDSRIKRLAQFVLDQAPGHEEHACHFCGAPAMPEPQHIVPLDAADEYEPGPERDALFGPDNLWWLCGEHAAGLRSWQETD
jgi:hypothetical protein